jgi:hypothetical protein
VHHQVQQLFDFGLEAERFFDCRVAHGWTPCRWQRQTRITDAL